jgi:hypothetical protein
MQQEQIPDFIYCWKFAFSFFYIKKELPSFFLFPFNFQCFVVVHQTKAQTAPLGAIVTGRICTYQSNVAPRHFFLPDKNLN